jgi:hypothetical protein
MREDALHGLFFLDFWRISMSLIDLDTNTDNVTALNDGDHDLFSHIVAPASAVTEAYITGSHVTALCGKRWVPTRDPNNYPVCPTCKEALDLAIAMKGG